MLIIEACIIKSALRPCEVEALLIGATPEIVEFLVVVVYLVLVAGGDGGGGGLLGLLGLGPLLLEGAELGQVLKPRLQLGRGLGLVHAVYRRLLHAPRLISWFLRILTGATSGIRTRR